MIVPIIITAAGMFFFYSTLGLAYSHLGVILAHTAIGTPFVVITVTATLMGFDESLIRASGSLGAKPLYTFFHVILPLITPGVISGALFAFITSFDEVVLVYFLADADRRLSQFRCGRDFVGKSAQVFLLSRRCSSPFQ